MSDSPGARGPLLDRRALLRAGGALAVGAGAVGGAAALGIATVIVAMGNPYVLGGITVAAALLVVWAFWPRESRKPRVSGASRSEDVS